MDRILCVEPKVSAAYLSRGEAYIGLGETEENLASALADYQFVLTIDEGAPLAYLGIADVYIRMGEYELAVEILQQGLIATDGDSQITEKLAEIESGMITDSSDQMRRKITYDYETGEMESYGGRS